MKSICKKIILITTPCKDSGVMRVQKQLMDYFFSCGDKLVVIQLKTQNSLTDISSIFNDYCEVITLETKNKNKVLRFLIQEYRLIKTLRKYEDYSIIALSNSANVALGFCSLFINNTTIVSERNDPNNYPESIFRRIVRDFAFVFPTRCVFQTNEAMKHFSKIIRRKGIIIKNPIDKNIPNPIVNINSNHIVATGRITKQKNYSMMLAAFNKFNKLYPNYILNIFGEGEEKKDLIEEIKLFKLENNVIIHNFTPNIYNEMKKSCMFINSSDYEGISNSMLEAMALGLPTICTDCPVGGAREVIKDGINGFLVPIKDSVALFNKMKMIIEDKDKVATIVKEAIKIREEYRIESIGKQWRDEL